MTFGQNKRYYTESSMKLADPGALTVEYTRYMTLGIVNEAQTAAAVLGHNFPDSTWYKHAYALVKTGGVAALGALDLRC